MELVKKLTLLTLAIMIVGCNEKVAPELKNGGVTSDSGDSDTETPDTYYFRVVDTSDDILGYKLHKTGNGNYKKKCEVSSSGVALSNGLYVAEGNASPAFDHDDKRYDITCYYDMEELALYANGFSFQIEASKNTCEYVSYSPFSFYDRQPGSSTAAVTRVECSGLTDASAVALGAVAQGEDGTFANCGEVVEKAGLATSNPLVSTTPRTDPGDAGLCEFDYSDQVEEGREPGQNCDIGRINLTTLSVEFDSSTGTTTVTPSTQVIDCAGKVSNCVQGPHKIEFSSQPWTSGYWVEATEKNTDFEKEYEYPNLIDDLRYGNYFYANFRSTLANSDLDYRQYSSDTFPAGQPTVWTQDSNRKRFDPKVMDAYYSNRYYGTTTQLITRDDHLAEATTSGYTHVPFAADPFMGLTVGNVSGLAKHSLVAPIVGGFDADGDSGFRNYRTQPFYTFHCLDAARDVKARIRIAVRDWDRSFSSTTALENISDYIGQTTPNLVSRQDNPVDQEIAGDNDFHNSYNDYDDWDNRIPMARTSGVTVIGTTFWEPETGYFNTQMFTNGYF